MTFGRSEGDKRNFVCLFVSHSLDGSRSEKGAVWSDKQVDCVRNVMTHAQKPDFVFRRNGRVNLNRRGASVQSTIGSRGVRICGSNAGYAMFRGSVKGTGYPLHSPVSPSLLLPCVTVSHHISTGLYRRKWTITSHWRPHVIRCFWPDGLTAADICRTLQHMSNKLMLHFAPDLRCNTSLVYIPRHSYRELSYHRWQHYLNTPDARKICQILER